MDPQAAASAFNQKYGRSTGNEAKYYAPSADTSGKAVIGLPDSYLSQESNGWSVTQRGGGGSGRGAAATAGPVKLNYTPTVMAARGVSPIAAIGTLQAPQYRPLSQIGVQ
jgi:hypothetical protein